MKFLVIFACAACFYTVQADDEAAFNATRSAIGEAIVQNVNEFDAFLEGLKQCKRQLVFRMDTTRNHFVRFLQTPKGKKATCGRELLMKINQLQQDFQQKLETSPKAGIVAEAIDEFMELMAICYSDLATLERYFDCPDEECKQEVRAEADEQLKRASEGLRVKEIIKIINNNYPGIDGIVEEFNGKLNDLKKELPKCAMMLMNHHYDLS